MNDRVNIGVVGGNEDFRTKLAELLQQSAEFALVASCATGQEALNLLPKQSAQIVLVDLDLPDKSSPEVVRELRRTAPSALLLILTAGGDARRLFEALAAGAEAYVVTTTTPERILEAVKISSSGLSQCSGSLAALILEHFSKPTAELEGLTERERTILTHLEAGRRVKEVSEELHINVYTLRVTLRTIFQKLAAHSRATAPVQEPAPGRQ